MAHFHIALQAGRVGYDVRTSERLELPDCFVVTKDEVPFHAEDVLEHAVQFVTELAVSGDRVSLDVTLP